MYPEQTVKCACPTCQCVVAPSQGVVRDGSIYCSSACAYDCTHDTCVCVHDRCDDEPDDRNRTGPSR